jgi:hypothetical protein
VVVAVRAEDMKLGLDPGRRSVDGIRQTTAKLETPVVSYKSDQTTWTEK